MLKPFIQLTCASFAGFALIAVSVTLQASPGQAPAGQVPAAQAPAVVLPASDTSAAPLAFEVATIKLALPIQQQVLSGKPHIGVNVDGARVDIGAMSLADLIGIAYKVKPHQISGPDWLNVDRFDVMAKIPEGVDKDKMPEMLQALLADRFKLTFHREDKDHQVYALIVGKNGPKLKESPPDPEPPKEGDAPPKQEKEEKGATVITNGDTKITMRQSANGNGNGTTTVSGGANGTMRMTMEDGHMHMEIGKMTLADFATVLSRFVDKPVIDMTDLKGNFQMALDLTMEDLQNVARAQGIQMPGPGAAAGGASSSHPADAASTPAGSSVFSSVQQMGLKLEARKAPLETIVIDHVEKAPTEN
jgi:uncharacterized protein (TIGR03435 family)